LNSGEKNASKRPEVRKRISESKLGIKNGNAKIWTLIFPDGFKVEIFGGIKRHLR